LLLTSLRSCMCFCSLSLSISISLSLSPSHKLSLSLSLSLYCFIRHGLCIQSRRRWFGCDGESVGFQKESSWKQSQEEARFQENSISSAIGHDWIDDLCVLLSFFPSLSFL
jgi:hypothetical protein